MEPRQGRDAVVRVKKYGVHDTFVGAGEELAEQRWRDPGFADVVDSDYHACAGYGDDGGAAGRSDCWG